jgi:hypothetical protein
MECGPHLSGPRDPLFFPNPIAARNSARVLCAHRARPSTAPTPVARAQAVDPAPDRYPGTKPPTSLLPPYFLFSLPPFKTSMNAINGVEADQPFLLLPAPSPLPLSIKAKAAPCEALPRPELDPCGGTARIIPI